jgi:hypothetical protein
MKITTPKGWNLEFKRTEEGWQSDRDLNGSDGISFTKNPCFIFPDCLYQEYSEDNDFENDIGQFIDFYLDNRYTILSQTKTAVNAITQHNHDFAADDEVNYIISYIEISYLKRYEFKINFVFMYGYAFYDIFYQVLSPEHFIINKVERLLNY